MKIALAVGSGATGGTELQVQGMAERFIKKGHAVTVVFLDGRGPVVEHVKRAGAAVVDLGWRARVLRSRSGRIRYSATALQYLRLLTLPWKLRQIRPDVVHAFLLMAYAVALPAAFVARVPHRVLGRRNLGTERTSSLRSVGDRLATACATAEVSNSHAVRLASSGGRGIVIYNGVTFPGALEIDTAEAVGDGRRLVVCVANFRDCKRHDLLIEAFSMLDQEANLALVGDGPARVAAQALTNRLSLTERVVFAGPCSDVSQWWKAAAVGVLVSDEEGLPNAILEAQAHGVPCVATAVGGTPEVVLDGRTGVLVPAGDAAAIAAAIDRLLDDDVLRKWMGANAKEHVTEQFSWDRCIADHLRLYGA